MHCFDTSVNCYTVWILSNRKAEGLWHSWQLDNQSISAGITYEVTFCFINHLVYFDLTIVFLFLAHLLQLNLQSQNKVIETSYIFLWWIICEKLRKTSWNGILLTTPLDSSISGMLIWCGTSLVNWEFLNGKCKKEKHYHSSWIASFKMSFLTPLTLWCILLYLSVTVDCLLHLLYSVRKIFITRGEKLLIYNLKSTSKSPK